MQDTTILKLSCAVPGGHNAQVEGFVERACVAHKFWMEPGTADGFELYDITMGGMLVRFDIGNPVPLSDYRDVGIGPTPGCRTGWVDKLRLDGVVLTHGDRVMFSIRNTTDKPLEFVGELRGSFTPDRADSADDEVGADAPPR